MDRNDVWGRAGKTSNCSRVWGQRYKSSVTRLRGRRSSRPSQGQEEDQGRKGPEEDLALISKLKGQKKNPFVYAITIGTYPNGLRVQGPLRPTPELARADRARMEALRSDLEEEGTQPKEIAEQMHA